MTQGHHEESGTTIVLAEFRRDVEGESSIESVRELSADEAGEIRTAARVVRTIARARAFRRVQELAALTLQRLALVESRGKPAAHEVDALVAGVRALVESRAQFAIGLKDIVADVESETTASSETESGHAEWGTLEALVADPGKLRRDRAGVVGVLVADDELVALRATVQRATFEAQFAFISALASRAEDVAAAGRTLRLLHAEAPEGRPIILDGWPPSGGSDQMKITPEELPLEDIPEAMRLTRTAHELNVKRPDFPTEAETLEPADEDVDGEHEVDGADNGDDAEADDNVDDAEADDNGPPLPAAPVDIAGLLSLARSLNDDLARAWSDGLERAQTSAAVAKQMAAVQGALVAVARKFQREQTVIEGGYPPSPTRRAELEASKDQADAVAVAQIAAVENVTRQLSTLTQPTTTQVTFGDEGPETLKRFWESGAFAQVAANLDLLRELLQPARDPGIVAKAAAFEHLRRAQAAWFGGDPESCLLHAVAGLSAELGVVFDALEDRVTAEPALRDNGSATAVAAGVRLSRRILSGESAIPLAVVLAPVVADALVDVAQPHVSERGMAADELFDFIAEELPFEPLGDDGPS